MVSYATNSFVWEITFYYIEVAIYYQQHSLLPSFNIYILYDFKS